MRVPLPLAWMICLFSVTALDAVAAPPPSLDRATVQAEVCAGTGLSSYRVEAEGKGYAVVPHEWLMDRFLPYFLDTVFRLGLRFTDEGFDCDNYARLFRDELNLQYRLQVTTEGQEPACAVFTVRQKRTFGVVPGQSGYTHALVLVRTEKGWYVVEPQDGTISMLGKYPNRAHLRRVYF